MPFIGTQPEVGGYSVLDALTASATASYTLQKDSANFVPNTANQLLVSLNGVIQKPGSSFTVSGSTLTFSSALTSSDSIDFIIAMGEPLLIGTPSDATVTGNKLASNIAITTSGNVSSSGNITTTGSGTMTSAGLITASSGVAIGGTGAANTLDDYEEGSWTPVIKDGATGNAAGMAHQQGLYTKVGNLVYVIFQLQINSVSGMTSSNQCHITGLPFTVNNDLANGAEPSGGIITYVNNLDTANYGQIFARANNGGTDLELKYSGTSYDVGGAGNFLISTFDSGSDTFMTGSCMYRV